MRNKCRLHYRSELHVYALPSCNPSAQRSSRSLDSELWCSNLSLWWSSHFGGKKNGPYPEEEEDASIASYIRLSFKTHRQLSRGPEMSGLFTPITSLYSVHCCQTSIMEYRESYCLARLGYIYLLVINMRSPAEVGHICSMIPSTPTIRPYIIRLFQ